MSCCGQEQLNATKKQMEELTESLNALALHNTELQRRQRLMTSVAMMQEEHICRMGCNQVLRPARCVSTMCA